MYDALNKGARIAEGELVGQVNTDDWYENDAVEKMAELYEKENYDVAWGSLNIHNASGVAIKRAKIGKMWTTNGWCHPAMFSKREILLRFPYACENMYDDFDYVTKVHQNKCKIKTYEGIVSNFSFGGMSTQKSIKSTLKRIEYRWQVYKKNGMSIFYLPYCIFIELVKFVMS